MKRFFVGIALCWTLCSSVASAHWQGTKWGMTPEQVAGVGKGSFPRVDPAAPDRGNGLTPMNRGTYKAANRVFEAQFWYRDRLLEQVSLKLVEGDCVSLPADLTGLYGKPQSSQLNRVVDSIVWADAQQGNRVAYLNIAGACSIDYTPLQNARNSGL